MEEEDNFVFPEKSMDFSPKVNFPDSGVSSKFKHRKNVVLPEPEGPIITAVLPFSMDKLIPLRTSNSPYRLDTFSTEIIYLPPHYLATPFSYRCSSFDCR